MGEDLILFKYFVNYLHLFLNTASQHQLLGDTVKDAVLEFNLDEPWIAHHVKGRMPSLTALLNTSEGGLTTVFRFLDTNESLRGLGLPWWLS